MKDIDVRFGDAWELIKQIPDHAIDLICIDPPYNLNKYSTGIIYTNWHVPFNNDIAAWDKDFHPEQWVETFARVLKPTGNLFAFCTYNTLGKWHYHYDAYERRIRGLSPVFDRFQRVIWHITNPAVSNRRAGYVDACQDIIHCYNKGHTWNFLGRGPGSGYLMHNFINGKHYAETEENLVLVEGGHCAGKERLRGEDFHPTQKPEYVTDWIVERATNPGDLVLDCFMGVGSCGASCKKLGRRFVGIEIDERYYDAACKRLGVEEER